MKRLELVVVVMSLLLLTLASCVKSEEPKANYENQNISILYFDESTFFQFYGDLIRTEFPNINITVIPSKGKNNEEVKNLITNQQPDIMILNNVGLYQQLIEENRLTALTFEKDDNFKFDEIQPMIIESLKELGNGTLYGLAPVFNVGALFYNKELFDAISLPYPTDQMTWNEVFQTADMFGVEHGVYGLDPWLQELDFIINIVGKTEKLTLVEPTDLLVTIQTDQWKNIWDSTSDAFNSGAIYRKSNDPNKQIITLEELSNKDLFLSGKAAIAYRSPNFIKQLEQTNIEWGVVTEPVSELDRNVSPGLSFNEIITINNATQNKDFALAVFKYLNSPELNQIRSRQLLGVPSRTLLDWKGQDISSLYKLEPDISNMFFNNLPYELWDQFYVKCEELYNLMKQGEIELDTMLVELEAWTELTLNAFIEEGKINH